MTAKRISCLALLWLTVPLTVRSGAQTITPESLQAVFDDIRSDDLTLRNETRARHLAVVSQWGRSDLPTMRAFLPVLISGLQDSNRDVRVSASAMFGLIGMIRPDDVLAFVDGFEQQILDQIPDDDDQTRANLISCFALANPTPPAIALPAMIDAANGPPSESRDVAALGLMRSASSSPAARDAVVALFDRTDDTDGTMRLAQLAALARPSEPAVVGRVAALLNHESNAVLLDAIRALRAIGGPAGSSIGQLQEIVESDVSDPELRRAAERAIASIRRGGTEP